MSTAVAFASSSGIARAPADYRALAIFNRYLRVVPANSEELLDQAYRLRFQVYCVEREFENAAEHPDGRECDRDDHRSLHSLLIDRATNIAVGTVRLILPRVGDDLPVFKISGSGERHGVKLPSQTTAEVSRFAIAKSFRRQRDNAWYPRAGASIASCSHALTSQLLTFGLVHAVISMSAYGGISHIVGILDPALLRLLGRLGVVFHPLGEPVAHHGVRQPGWAAMANAIAGIKNRHPELGEIIDRTWAPTAGPSSTAPKISTLPN